MSDLTAYIITRTVIIAAALVIAIFIYAWISKQLLVYAEPLAGFIGRTAPRLLKSSNLSVRERKIVTHILKKPTNSKIAWATLFVLFILIPVFVYSLVTGDRWKEEKKPLTDFDKVFLSHIALSMAASPIAFLLIQLAMLFVVLLSAPKRAVHILISSLEKVPQNIICKA